MVVAPTSSTSYRMSRCILSWAPLSSGWAGRPRITRIPSDTHQADSDVIPSLARGDANGGPLSTCIANGSPFVSNNLTNTRLTLSLFVSVINSAHNTKWLFASRTVNGSHFAPSFVLHHPLKSTVHRSFGSFAATSGAAVDLAPGLRRRRRTRSPARSMILAIVRSDGTSSASIARSSTTRSFFGPQVGCSRRSRTTLSTASPDALRGELCGLLDRSSSPFSPRSLNRFIHLYAVLRLIPYSCDSSVTFANGSSALNTNSCRTFMTLVFTQGIARIQA